MTQDGGASGEAGVQAHFFGKLMHIRDLFGNHDDRMTLLLDQIQIAKALQDLAFLKARIAGDHDLRAAGNAGP